MRRLAHARVRHRVRPARAVAAIAGLAFMPHALLAQGEGPEPDTTLVAEAMEMEFLAGPLNLPGHEEGARERPEVSEKAAAPTGDEPRDWFGGKPWWEWSTALGDLAGARTALEGWGLSIAGSYTFDLVGAWSGGLDQRGTSHRLLDFNATLDLEKAFGIKGGTLYADFQSTAGNSPSRFIGDFQGTSNLETGESLDYVAELWYEQRLFDGVLRIKAGKIDGFYEFGYADASTEFLNSGAGVDPANPMLPGYPDPSTAVLAFVYPTEKWYIGAGFFDGAAGDGVNTGGRGPATFLSDDLSDDSYAVGETGVTFDLGFVKDLRLAAGVWYHDGDFARWDGGTDSGTIGFYVVSEGVLWQRDGGNEEDERGLSAFVRYGHADDEVFEIGNALSGGLSLRGTFEGRDYDSAGVWVGWADLSDEPGAGFAGDEIALEVYYRVSVTPFVHIVPDLQFVFDPSGRDDIGDAVVASLRVTIDF